MNKINAHRFVTSRTTATLGSLLVSAIFGIANANADECNTALRVQTLGSGTETTPDKRALNSYIVWIDHKPRVLVDVGTGSAQNFIDSGARSADVDALLLSQLSVNHTSDLPALIAIAQREQRARALDLYGPLGQAGTAPMPSTVAFVRALFDSTSGAYRHLGSVLSPLTKDRFKLHARDVRRRSNAIGARVQRARPDATLPIATTGDYRIVATYLANTPYPALAWRIDIGNRRIVFATAARHVDNALQQLAQNADLLIVPHVVTEDAPARERHLSPSDIGRLAQTAGAKRVVLAARGAQTLGAESATSSAIRARFVGATTFAEDLACYSLP